MSTRETCSDGTTLQRRGGGYKGNPSQVSRGILFLMSAFCLVSITAHAQTLTGDASWYSTEACKFNPHKGCPTASGRSLYDLEEEDVDFAAMWDLAFGTRVRVTNRVSGASVIVKIYDRGPARRLHRVIDLSKSSFAKIEDPKKGIAQVTVEVMK